MTNEKIGEVYVRFHNAGLTEGLIVSDEIRIAHLAVIESNLEPAVVLRNRSPGLGILWVVPPGQQQMGVRDSAEARAVYLKALDQAPKPGLYRHYKGNLYDVLGVAVGRDNLEAFVIYRCKSTGFKWLRPVSGFKEQVSVPRFAAVEDSVP